MISSMYIPCKFNVDGSEYLIQTIHDMYGNLHFIEEFSSRSRLSDYGSPNKAVAVKTGNKNPVCLCYSCNFCIYFKNSIYFQKYIEFRNFITTLSQILSAI